MVDPVTITFLAVVGINAVNIIGGWISRSYRWLVRNWKRWNRFHHTETLAHSPPVMRAICEFINPHVLSQNVMETMGIAFPNPDGQRPTKCWIPLLDGSISIMMESPDRKSVYQVTFTTCNYAGSLGIEVSCDRSKKNYFQQWLGALV